MLIKKKSKLRKNKLKDGIIDLYNSKAQDYNKENNNIYGINVYNYLKNDNFLQLNNTEKEKYILNILDIFKKLWNLKEEKVCLDILKFVFKNRLYFGTNILKEFILMMLNYINIFSLKSFGLVFFYSIFRNHSKLIIQIIENNKFIKIILYELNLHDIYLTNYNDQILDIIKFYLQNVHDIEDIELNLVLKYLNKNYYFDNSKEYYIILVNKLLNMEYVKKNLSKYKLIINNITNCFNNLVNITNKELIISIVLFLLNNGFKQLDLDFQIIYNKSLNKYKISILNVLITKILLTNNIYLVSNIKRFLEFLFSIINYNNSIDSNCTIISIINIMILNIPNEMIELIFHKVFIFNKIKNLYNINDLNLRCLIDEMNSILLNKKIFEN